MTAMDDDNHSVISSSFSLSSPTSNANYQQQQQQSVNSTNHHVFLPPTSPAVVQQPRSNTQAIPTPSPVHNYFVQSPGIAESASKGGPTSNNPSSIAQSPGFANFGSPALPHSSPTTNSQQQQQQSATSFQQQQQQQQPILSNQQLSSASVQSPSSHSGFMSPATGQQQQNYSIQSPANFSELSLSSPVNSAAPIRSPYVGGPPSATNIPSVNSMQNSVQDDQAKSSIINQNPRSINSNMVTTPSGSGPSNAFSNQQQQQPQQQLQQQQQQTAMRKTQHDSFVVYLSENGFLKMVTSDPDTSFSPLETFLATNHLKRIFLKAIQADPTMFSIKSAENNIFKTGFIELQIINEITPHFHAFQLTLAQQPQLPAEISIDSLQKYLNTKILVSPFKASNLISFLHLLSVSDLKLVKELTQLLEYEMNPGYYKFPWKLKFSWTIPFGYQLKNLKPNLALFYQTQTNQGFQRKEKFHFMLFYLISQHRMPNPTIPSALLLLIGYDSINNTIQHELLRPTSGDSPIYNAYETHINSIILNKQKDQSNFSLLGVIYDLLSHLQFNTSPQQQPIVMPPQNPQQAQQQQPIKLV